MNKVIYITIFALTPQIEQYLLIQETIEAGIIVEYWDLKRIYFKGRQFKNEISRGYVREINSLEVLKDNLKNEVLAKSLFILQVNFEWRVISLYLMVTRLGCKIAYFPWVPYMRVALIAKIIDKIRPAVFYRAFLNLAAKLLRKTGLIKKYDLVFTAGKLTRDSFNDQGKVVDINYQDYDLYMISKNKTNRIVEAEYCVFLDDGCVHNPNVELLKMEELDPVNFYNALNSLFDAIEKKCKLKVVVAAHPGIGYERNTFGTREIFEERTCDLVKDSKFVIAQSSTATSFAVLFKKPVVFIYTDEYIAKRKPSFRYLQFLVKQLGSRAYNIDRKGEVEAFEVPGVNVQLFDKYKYYCLTSKESENELSKDIVVRTLKNLRL